MLCTCCECVSLCCPSTKEGMSSSACRMWAARELPPGASSRGTLGRLRLCIILWLLHTSCYPAVLRECKNTRSPQRLPAAEVMAIGWTLNSHLPILNCYFFQRPCSGENMINFHIYEHMIQHLDTLTCKHCFMCASMGESSQHLLHASSPNIVSDLLILKVIFMNLQPF